jgi:hypothetical protein
MNLQDLNVGIANLVENNGRLELELHREKEQSALYRKWWEDSQKREYDLKELIEKKNKEIVEIIKFSATLDFELNNFQKEAEQLFKEDKKTLKIESVINRLSSILKKSKDANKNH